LQIEENRGWTSQFRGDLANGGNARGMLGLRAMRGVEAEHIHAGLQQLPDGGLGIAGGTECRDYFGIGHTPLLAADQRK
jgi:hypothetical protein